MNKSNLIEIVAARANISAKEATEIVNVVFDSLREALANGKRIEMRGFGSFAPKQYGAYAGRNPKSGKPIDVPAKTLPFFKTGKQLKERVNRHRHAAKK